jgi:hypothetical protein
MVAGGKYFRLPVLKQGIYAVEAIILDQKNRIQCNVNKVMESRDFFSGLIPEIR